MSGFSKRKNSTGWLIAIAMLLGLAATFFFGFPRYRINDSSMEPVLSEGDIVVVSRLPFLTGSIQRGDLVAFASPIGENQTSIKRVIAVATDTISVVGGIVYLNGVEIDEPYLVKPGTRDMAEAVVPDGMVFVLGDNRDSSADSAIHGPVGLDQVIGKVTWIW